MVQQERAALVSFRYYAGRQLPLPLEDHQAGFSDYRAPAAGLYATLASLRVVEFVEVLGVWCGAADGSIAETTYMTG